MRLPGVCIVCRAPVMWTGKRWQEAPVGLGSGRAHVCPAERPTCGAWMPNARERCARRAGHASDRGWGGHRTRYALDNATRRWAA